MVIDVLPARDRPAAVRWALTARILASVSLVSISVAMAISQVHVETAALAVVAVGPIVVLAIALALFALVKAGRMPTEHMRCLRRHACVAIVMGVLCFPIGWFALQPLQRSVLEDVRRSSEDAKLKSLSVAIYQYHQREGKLPGHPADLLVRDLGAGTLLSPHRGLATPVSWPPRTDEPILRYGDRVFTYRGLPIHDGERIVAFTPLLGPEPAAAQRYVLYMDGRIVRPDEDYFLKLVENENRVREEQYGLPPIEPARFDARAAGIIPPVKEPQRDP